MRNNLPHQLFFLLFLFFQSLCKTESKCPLQLTLSFDFSPLDQIWESICAYSLASGVVPTPLPWHNVKVKCGATSSGTGISQQ